MLRRLLNRNAMHISTAARICIYVDIAPPCGLSWPCRACPLPDHVVQLCTPAYRTHTSRPPPRPPPQRPVPGPWIAPRIPSCYRDNHDSPFTANCCYRASSIPPGPPGCTRQQPLPLLAVHLPACVCANAHIHMHPVPVTCPHPKSSPRAKATPPRAASPAPCAPAPATCSFGARWTPRARGTWRAAGGARGVPVKREETV